MARKIQLSASVELFGLRVFGFRVSRYHSWVKVGPVTLQSDILGQRIILHKYSSQPVYEREYHPDVGPAVWKTFKLRRSKWSTISSR